MFGFQDIYNEMLLMDDYGYERAQNIIRPFLPQIEYDVRLPEGKRFILFGAGNYGLRAARCLQGEVECFADNNSQKVGLRIGEISIKSAQAILDKAKYSDKCHVVISTDYKYQLDLIRLLETNGIHCFSVFPHVINYNKAKAERT